MAEMSAKERLSRGFEPVTKREWIMVGLAALNVALLFVNGAYDAFLPAWLRQWIIPIDLGLLVIFGGEFLTRLLRADKKVMFLRSHWYDAVGLIPAASVTFRALRLLRVARMLVVAKLPYEKDPDWMFALIRGGVVSIVGILVQEMIKPLILMGTKMVKLPLRKARVASMAGNILDAQKDGIEQVALASLRIAKPLKPVADSAAGQKLVHAVTVSVLGTVADFLKTDEVNELMADTIDAVLDQTVEAMGRAATPSPA